MIPSLLDELKEGKFKLTKTELDPYGIYRTYETESHWVIETSDLIYPLVNTTYINQQKVGWIFGWRIRRAIKKGYKREQTES